MDFGEVSHKQTSPSAGGSGLTELRNEKGHGSVNLKHERSGLAEDTHWSLIKMQKPGEVGIPFKKTSAESFTAFGRSNLWASGIDGWQKMLSFSSPELQCNGGMAGTGSSRSIAFSIFPDEHRSRTGGCGLTEGERGPFLKLKGPFTPSQWMELEHQAVIYKHLVANVPVPSSLLVPLKRSLYPFGSPGSYASNFLGWGPFHLGFFGSNDPEPGRCRRTDGKKWRCSRDAVPDQKYCERHINRGRHRSRKPVEGQTGHAVSGSTTSKLAPIASSSAPVSSSSSTSNSLCGAIQHPFNCLQSINCNASADHLLNRAEEFQGLSLIPPISDLKSKGMQFSVQKQHVPFEEPSQLEFGLVTSDSLVNPSVRIPFMDSRNSDSFLGFNEQEANNQHPVRHFIEDWPKDQSNRSSVSWPEELKSDWTQLSMSTPMAPPDFSSSSSSSRSEKSTISNVRLSCEFNPIQMRLGISNNIDEQIHKLSSWPPICWGNSMGGPLGEALTSTTTSTGASKSFLSSKEWNGSPKLGSSPTDVLHKSTFVMLSNSSSGSSPPRDKKTPENASLCNVLGAAHTTAAIPSL